MDFSPAHVCSHGAPPPASGNKPHKDGSGWAGPALPRPCAGQRAGVPQSAPALTNRSVSDPPYYPIPHRGTSGRPSTPSVPPLFPDGTAIFRRLKGAIPRGLNSGEGTTAWRGVKHLACRQQERALRSAEIKRIHWQRRRATVMMSHAVAVSRGPCASCLSSQALHAYSAGQYSRDSARRTTSTSTITSEASRLPPHAPQKRELGGHHHSSFWSSPTGHLEMKTTVDPYLRYTAPLHWSSPPRPGAHSHHGPPARMNEIPRASPQDSLYQRVPSRLQ